MDNKNRLENIKTQMNHIKWALNEIHSQAFANSFASLGASSLQNTFDPKQIARMAHNKASALAQRNETIMLLN